MKAGVRIVIDVIILQMQNIFIRNKEFICFHNSIVLGNLVALSPLNRMLMGIIQMRWDCSDDSNNNNNNDGRVGFYKRFTLSGVRVQIQSLS